MVEPKKLKDCISNSIKKQEKEYKEQNKKAEEERKEKIKVIRHFFKQILPRNKEFIFEPTGPIKKINIKRKRLTGEIEIDAALNERLMIGSFYTPTWVGYIEIWNLLEIRWMYDNLPWFEAELRRKYGCENL